MSIFRVRPGDAGFIPIGRDLYYRAGHLTIKEWCERIRLHAILIIAERGGTGRALSDDPGPSSAA